MEKLFVQETDNNWSNVLYFILMILTIGLAWFFYDDFIERKYMVNRRRLIKVIQNGEVTLIKKLPPSSDESLDAFIGLSDIEMYDLIHGEDIYDLWLWTKTNGVVKAIILGDHIGLFTGTFGARRLNDRLVKAIKEQANG
jgi:hypothetical protein